MSGRWMPPEGLGGPAFYNGQGLDALWFAIAIGIAFTVWLAMKP